jgi:Ca2+-binding EF-hand superfamily protein
MFKIIYFIPGMNPRYRYNRFIQTIFRQKVIDEIQNTSFKDKKGIDVPDFIRVFQRVTANPYTRANFEQDWSKLDTQRQGFIATADLVLLLKRFGDSLSASEAAEFSNLVDPRGKGEVTPAEIANAYVNTAF